MGKIALALSFLFVFTNCGMVEEARFASVDEGKELFQRGLQSRIAEERVEKIGRKSVKKDAINLEASATVTNSKNNKVDIVFYIDGNVRSVQKGFSFSSLFSLSRSFKKCLVDFGEDVHKSGFLHHIDSKTDWQFSFSTFSKKKTRNHYLEWSTLFFSDRKNTTWTRKRILRKGDRDRFTYDTVFYHSITPLYNSRYNVGSDAHVTVPRRDLVYDAPEYRSNKHRKDPLAGLGYLLSHDGNVRLDSNIVVFIIAYVDFPYNETELEEFKKRHPNVTFNVLTPSKRHQKVPGLIHLAESSGGNWFALCEKDNIGPVLAQSILDSL